MESCYFPSFRQKTCRNLPGKRPLPVPSTLSRNMYAVGYADIAENQNWVVACDPSYTSLSLEEISQTGRLTHLDVDFPQHDNCINSCAFNATSTKIAYSLGSESVRLWDVTSNSELANIHVSKPVHHLKHYIEEDSWLGIMSKSIALVDARDKQLSPINLPFSPSCFSISPNKQLIAIGDTNSTIHLFDPRQLHTPLHSYSLHSSFSLSPPLSLSWDQWSRSLLVNSGEQLLWMDIVQSIYQSNTAVSLNVTANKKYPRSCALYDDEWIVYGNDEGSVFVHSIQSGYSTSLSVSSSKSPIISILPLPSSSSVQIPDAFIITTDTEMTLISLSQTNYRRGYLSSFSIPTINTATSNTTMTNNAIPGLTGLTGSTDLTGLAGLTGLTGLTGLADLTGSTGLADLAGLTESRNGNRRLETHSENNQLSSPSSIPSISTITTNAINASEISSTSNPTITTTTTTTTITPTGEGEVTSEEEEMEVVTFQEDAMAEGAQEWMLQGTHSDYMQCSYELHGCCSQQVFVCQTCRDQYDRLLRHLHPTWSMAEIRSIFDIGALCEQCAHFCHELKGHEVVALGVKPAIACDCGNALFRRLDGLLYLESGGNIPATFSIDDLPTLHQCELCHSKPSHTANTFNHNWRERWCYCDQEEELPMVQCVGCFDWFHEKCAKEKYMEVHGESIDLEDEKRDFYCVECEQKRTGEMVEIDKDKDKETRLDQDNSSSQQQQQQHLSPEQSHVLLTEDCSRANDEHVNRPTLEEEERKEESEESEEKRVERRIRAKLKKNDKPGAMKIIMRYILKQSLSQSTSNQRSIVVQNDVARAAKMLENIINKIKREHD